MIFRPLFSALLHGMVSAIVGFLIFMLVSIVTGVIIFVLSLLAQDGGSAIAMLVFISIFAFAMSMLAWTQTLRYTASMAGYRTIDRMPPFGAAWLASTVAAFLLTIAVVVVFAVIGFLVLLSLGYAPETWKSALEDPSWANNLTPENVLIWIVGYIAWSNLTMCCWTTVLMPLVCGPSERPGAYSAGMIFARFFIAVPFFTAAAIGLALMLTSSALEDLARNINSGVTTMNPAFIALLLPGWLGMGWIMSFEALLLAARPTVSKADIKVFEGPTSNAAQEDYRSLRKQWQDRS